MGAPHATRRQNYLTSNIPSRNRCRLSPYAYTARLKEARVLFGQPQNITARPWARFDLGGFPATAGADSALVPCAHAPGHLVPVPVRPLLRAVAAALWTSFRRRCQGFKSRGRVAVWYLNAHFKSSAPSRALPRGCPSNRCQSLPRFAAKKSSKKNRVGRRVVGRLPEF